jgi:hypothetical protein
MGNDFGKGDVTNYDSIRAELLQSALGMLTVIWVTQQDINNDRRINRGRHRE